MNQKTLITVLVVLVIILTGTTVYFATLQKQIASNQPIILEKNNTNPKADLNIITEQDMKDLYAQMAKEIPDYLIDAGEDYEFKIFAKNGRYIHATLTSKSKELNSRPSFFAYKSDDGWKIIFSGQEAPDCSKVNALNFPKDIISSCFDGSKLIQR